MVIDLITAMLQVILTNKTINCQARIVASVSGAVPENRLLAHGVLSFNYYR